MFFFLTKINYMKHAKSFLIFSLVITLASVGAVFGIGLNRGIDFTGGLLMEVQYDQSVTNAEIESKVSAVAGSKAQVQQVEVKGSDNPNATEFLIRVPQLDEQQREALFKALGEIGEFKKISEDEVSASVSRELTEKAAMAVAIAAVLQIIYITLRFEFRFGVTAVVALLHDLVVTLGLIALFQVQINAPFVAAILTVLGYSINDTIVTFDRIRENLANKRKSEKLEDLTTRSIQETVQRSLYTSLSTLLVLAALLVFGGSSTWDMAMTLFIGVAAGAYSSIFVASALWLKWRKWDDANKAAGKPVKA